MDLSVLIPWRSDFDQRERVFQHVLKNPAWSGAEICIGTDTGSGPFNCAMAINDAFRQATSDNLAMFGADCIPDPYVIQNAPIRLQTEHWFPLFSATGYYSKEASARIMSGEPYQEFPFEVQYPYCEGLLGLTREAYHRSGGMDERFVGWGAEDSAFRHTLWRLYGEAAAFPATLGCLWHREDHRILGPANRALVDSYNRMDNASEMEAFLAERGSFV